MREKISSFLQTGNNFKKGQNKTKSSLEFLSSHTPAWCGAEQSLGLEFVFICIPEIAVLTGGVFPTVYLQGIFSNTIWYQISDSNTSWLPSNPIHRLEGLVQQDCPHCKHQSQVSGPRLVTWHDYKFKSFHTFSLGSYCSRLKKMLLTFDAFLVKVI